MPGNMTPEEVLNSVTEGINAPDLDSLMTLYEPLACFASQPGQLAKSPDGIRQSLRNFIDMNGKLELKVKRVLRANDLALVTTEWSFNGTDSDGKHVHMSGKSADVLRQQPDQTWRFVIDNPWGTD
jgi:ketosteroid isomerase-like protein